MPSAEATDATSVREQMVALLSWPDCEAALMRALDVASDLLTDVGLGDPIDEPTRDAMVAVAYVLGQLADRRKGVRR